MAWSACNDMNKIWSSKLPCNHKVEIFSATDRLDGTYTRLLMRVKNLSWKRHPSHSQIYGSLPRASSIVRSRRAQFAGHCYRAKSEVISTLLLWSPTQTGPKSRKLSYPDVIARDTGINKQELGRAMGDREVWRSIVKSIISTEVET